MVVDGYGRMLRALRIVVNKDCNLGCIYCHREGLVNETQNTELTYNEIGIIAKIAISLGVEKFKLTGGEPLLRKDIVELVKALAEAKPKDLSMTTNGTLLSLYIYQLIEVGLRRININLPSLNKNKYRYITGKDLLDNVLNGINIAYDMGLRPITINVVVLKDITSNEYKNFIDLASSIEGRLRLIELEPLGLAKKTFEHLYEPIDGIVEYLEENCIKRYVREENHRPVYVLDNGVEVEIVRWNKNREFCMYCDRIRLMYNGLIKPCIAKDELINLVNCLRPIVDEECIKNVILNANKIRKPFWSTI